jgi:hypothetical protein
MRATVAAGVVVIAALAPGNAVPYEARVACPAEVSAEFFIPRTVLEPTRPDSDDFVRRWYSKHLRAMSEPSLSCGALAEAEVYRFLWLRTFHRPIAIRVARTITGTTLVGIELTGAGGYEPGAVAQRVQRAVSTGEWESLTKALGAIDFWRAPTEVALPGEGLDGSQWIIEGRRGGQYHLVDRWSPRDAPYRNVGLTFLRLAGFTVADNDIY